MLLEEKAKSFFRERGILIAVLSLAVFLTVYRPGFFMINADVDVRIAEFLITTGENGILQYLSFLRTPVYNALLLIPIFLTGSIYSSIIVFTTLQLVSVFTLYKIGTDFFNKRAGLISSLLFITFYYTSTISSRPLYNLFIVTPFTLTALYFLFSAVLEKKQKHLLFAVSFLILSTMINAISFVFIATCFIVLISFRSEMKSKYFLPVLLFVLIPLGYIFLSAGIPHLRTGVSEGLFNISRNFFAGTGEMPRVLNTVFGWSELQRTALSCSSYGNLSVASLPFIGISFGILKTFSIFGIIFLVLKTWQEKDLKNKYSILLLLIFSYLIILPFALAYGNIYVYRLYEVQSRYFAPIIPLVFIIIGIVFSDLLEKVDERISWDRAGKISVLALIGIIAIPQIYLSLAILNNETCLRGSDKEEVVDVLVNDFCIQNYDTYIENVNHAGLGAELGLNQHGFDSLFHLQERKECEPSEGSHILVARRGALEKSQKQIMDVKEERDLGEVRILSYEFNEAFECGTGEVFNYLFKSYEGDTKISGFYNETSETVELTFEKAGEEQPTEAEVFFERTNPLEVSLEEEMKTELYEVEVKEDEKKLTVYMNEIKEQKISHMDRPKESEVEVLGFHAGFSGYKTPTQHFIICRENE